MCKASVSLVSGFDDYGTYSMLTSMNADCRLVNMWTKTDRKRETIRDSDNPFSLPTKRHVFALLFLTVTLLPGDLTCIQTVFFKYKEGVYDRRSQVTTPLNRRGLFSPLPESDASYQSLISTIMADSSSESDSDSPVVRKAKYVKIKSLLVELKENSRI